MVLPQAPTPSIVCGASFHTLYVMFVSVYFASIDRRRLTRLVDAHETIAGRPWERSEQDAVDDAEERRRRRDAERDHHDGDKGVARLAPDQPNRVTEVESEAGKA